MKKRAQKNERGAALVLALLALLLLSGLGAFMFLASNTETYIDKNYSGGLRAYYGARSGLEEVRDRASYASTSTPGGLADLLPTDVAGNAGGVLYVLNPANGENVDPADITSPYFDDQLCHEYASGSISGVKCWTVPQTAGWKSATIALAPATGPLSYKWVRINMKTNRSADPYLVDSTASPDARVCFDGETEQVSPGGTSPCDANGMQQVYMLTSLAVTQGTHRLLRAEIVGPSIRPPGAITMEVSGSTSSNPIPSTFNNVLIPATSIDGRVHGADGFLSAAPTCSAVSPLAANTAQGSTSLQNGLNDLRRSIVTAANSFCGADGSSIVPPNICTPALAWVRGTGTDPRFVTTSTSTSPTTTITPTPTPTPSPTPTSNSGHDGHDHSPTPTPTPTSSLTSVSSTDCAVSQSTCYRNLDLSAPQLSPAPLFIGNPGNSGDPLVYQAQASSVVVDENQAVLDYVAARKASGLGYYEVASTSLAATYGSPTQPVVLVITDTSLALSTSLTGYGILVVPNDFEIQNSTLQWTGIVMVRSSSAVSGVFLINSGAAGFINGAVMLQSGSQFAVTTSSLNANQFTIAYSCDAIDFAMGSRPLKVISATETSY